MVADLADSRGRERNFLQQMLWTPRGPHRLHVRVQALTDDLHTAFKRSHPAPWECTTLHLRPCRRKVAPHRNVSASHRGPRTSRLCVVSAGTSAPRPSLGAWAPKPITVNHRSRQFFARACNREGVINPSNSVERSLRGTQDVTMLGGVVALERVDDNVCHWRAPGSGDL